MTATEPAREMGRGHAVLSYFEEYFTPEADAPLSGHSTGQIARHLFLLLDARMGCRYVSQQPVAGLEADVFVGHFWSFLDFCRANTFRKRIAVYPVADPRWTQSLLRSRAAEFDVPMPWWDLPPAEFDHRATMEAADAILVVGNSFTLNTFSPRDRRKIRLVNYAPDERLLINSQPSPAATNVCYVATHCDLRKGFMDVLETWSGIGAGEATLHVLGAIRDPWVDRLGAHRGANITYHGWINSKDPMYRDVLRSCRYAYLPTYSEGQVGSLLEAIQQGCIPITTRASGIDDAVLEHCVVVEPRDIAGQRRAIRDALSWSDPVFFQKRDRLLEVMRRTHDWARFNTAVSSLLDEVSA